MGAKWFCLCFPEGKGLLKGWKLLSEKLKSLGVGLKEGTVKKTTAKMAPPIKLKKKSSPYTKSFAEAILGKEHGASTEAIRVTVGEEKTTERLRRLSCCLVGWWGGGTLSMQELKSIKRRVWYAWEVRGSLNVVKMGKGLWLFEFDNKNEAERILKVGIRKLGGFSIFLKKWAKEDGCETERNFEEMAWARMISLPAHLWSRPILRRIGDRCGGFLAMDEDTTFLSDLRWARIRVKRKGKTLPPCVEVFEGQSIYDIQLWWDIQPSVKSANALTDMIAGNELREDEEEGARTGESMGVLGSRQEKIDGIEDVSSSKEIQTGCLAQKQADKADPWMDQTRGASQYSGLTQMEAGSSQTHGLVIPGHHGSAQVPQPSANLLGLTLGKPILRASGKFLGLA